MELDYTVLSSIRKAVGESFYILDEEQVKRNFIELKQAFIDIYPKMNIAYSYKTNYTPRICKIIADLGGYAEVVSDMEYRIAKQIGNKDSKIIFNGPYKKTETIREMLLKNGIVNIDGQADFNTLKEIAREFSNQEVSVGIRCNFDVKDGVISRFGIDSESPLFGEIISYIENTPNVKLRNLHCHFASRSLEYWPNRATLMFDLIDRYKLYTLEHIDLGGGLFGKMADSLKKQFSMKIPSYREYARAIATLFSKRYAEVEEENRPELIIEPGSALVGDVMKFAAKVTNIKNIRGKDIATVLGSIYNINPTLNTKNPPLEIFSPEKEMQKSYTDLDFGGFTCIESDYLYRHFKGELAVGDYAVFGNVGSYSVVLKPPFILPNFTIVSISKGEITIIKEAETFDDIFKTFIFEEVENVSTD